MIDLTRALYLGMTHPSTSLRPWAALTTGRPAVLDRGHAEARDRLGRLVGAASVTLAPSTLHIVTDLYAALPRRVRAIHVDACAYAVTRWGLERAKLRGVTVRRFHGVAELERRIGPGEAIVTDGMCVACRCVKPLRALARLAERTGGWLVVDDTQAIGVLGAGPSPQLPFGRGGAGTMAWCDAPMDRAIVFGSLAKGLGVPLAFLAGSADAVEWFERESQTRIHASPCSAAPLAALAAALDILDRDGDRLRARLLDRVRAFRQAAGEHEDVLTPGMFPVQTTPALASEAARALQRRLASRGVRTIALAADRDRGRIAFIVTAAHERERIATAGRILADEWASIARRAA